MIAAWFIDIIKSVSGRLRIDNLAGYDRERDFNELGDNDFTTKLMLQSIGVESFTYTADVGDPWPVVLTNGDEFTTQKNNVIVSQLLDPDGTQRTNNGAGSIIRVNYTDSSKEIISTIVVETTTDGSGLVSDRTVITVLPI